MKIDTLITAGVKRRANRKVFSLHVYREFIRVNMRSFMSKDPLTALAVHISYHCDVLFPVFSKIHSLSQYFILRNL